MRVFKIYSNLSGQIAPLRVIKRLQSCYCPPKKSIRGPPKNVKVALLGAKNKTGQATAMLLKTNPLISQLRLFDWTKGTSGITADLMCIDTHTLVISYTGICELRQCVSGCHIVVVIGGYSETPCVNFYDLFQRNAELVRETASYTAEFNRNGIFCISTPPVEAMVPLALEVYKKEKVYDPRKVIGITSVWQSRINAIAGKYLNKDPSTLSVPIAGGTEPKTFIPVFSSLPATKDLSGNKDLLEEIYFAEDKILCKKEEEKSGAVTLSPAYSIAQFINCLVEQVKGDKKSQIAFVKQLNEDVQGVNSTTFPNLTTGDLLEWNKRKSEVICHTAWGKSYLNGEKPKSFRCIQSDELIDIEYESDKVVKKNKQ